MKNQIIMINGKKQSGKDTIANWLYTKHEFKKVSFAHALKKYSLEILQNCLGVDGITLQDFENESFKRSIIPLSMGLNKNACSYRKFLQVFGTEFMRELFSDDFWSHILVSSLIPGNNYVISDFRFPNEFSYTIQNASEEFNISTIRVNRGSADHTDTHSSETALDNFSFDYEISNNGTLDSLYVDVDDMLTAIERNLTLTR